MDDILQLMGLIALEYAVISQITHRQWTTVTAHYAMEVRQEINTYRYYQRHVCKNKEGSTTVKNHDPLPGIGVIRSSAPSLVLKGNCGLPVVFAVVGKTLKKLKFLGGVRCG